MNYLLEFDGSVTKIEETNVTNVLKIFFDFESESTKMSLELAKQINPFKESEPVKIIFDTEPHRENEPKLILNGFLYSSSKKEDIYQVFISIGGLQLKIDSSNAFEELKTKKDLVLTLY